MPVDVLGCLGGVWVASGGCLGNVSGYGDVLAPLNKKVKSVCSHLRYVLGVSGGCLVVSGRCLGVSEWCLLVVWGVSWGLGDVWVMSGWCMVSV